MKDIESERYKQNNLFFICYDCLHRNSEGIYRKIISNNKRAQQCSCVLQDQYTQSIVFLYNSIIQKNIIKENVSFYNSIQKYKVSEN